MLSLTLLYCDNLVARLGAPSFLSSCQPMLVAMPNVTLTQSARIWIRRCPRKPLPKRWQPGIQENRDIPCVLAVLHSNGYVGLVRLRFVRCSKLRRPLASIVEPMLLFCAIFPSAIKRFTYSPAHPTQMSPCCRVFGLTENTIDVSE